MNGIAQEFLRQFRNLLRHGGREENGLTLHRHHRHEFADRVNEAHVEHLIGFVEDEDFDAIDAKRFLPDEIEQTPRRGDKNVDAIGKRAHLVVDRDTAVNDGARQFHVAAIDADVLRNLACEFTRGAQDERTAGTARGFAAILIEALQDRQRERCRFAGSRLGDANQIMAFKQGRDRLLLDRGRRFVVFGRQRLQKGRREAEFSKSRHFILSECARSRAQHRWTLKGLAGRTKGV